MRKAMQRREVKHYPINSLGGKLKLKVREGKCPECGSKLGYSGILIGSAGNCYYNVDCFKSSCEWEGEENYNLVFTEFTS